ncbi:MAG: hypothetical protein J0I70_05045, partial [Microbacterium sp.]|nr:hypothetical protein [Microbacterium sp.]
MSQPTKPAPGGRRTIARHGRLRSPHPVSQLVKLLAVGLADLTSPGIRYGYVHPRAGRVLRRCRRAPPGRHREDAETRGETTEMSAHPMNTHRTVVV